MWKGVPVSNMIDSSSARFTVRIYLLVFIECHQR